MLSLRNTCFQSIPLFNILLSLNLVRFFEILVGSCSGAKYEALDAPNGFLGTLLLRWLAFVVVS